jgi:hypothetical protein
MPGVLPEVAEPAGPQEEPGVAGEQHLSPLSGQPEEVQQ